MHSLQWKYMNCDQDFTWIPADIILVLVQIMAWHRTGKLLSEPMMVSLLTHICVTQSQWVKKRTPDEMSWYKSALLTDVVDSHAPSLSLSSENHCHTWTPNCTRRFIAGILLETNSEDLAKILGRKPASAKPCGDTAQNIYCKIFREQLCQPR